MKKNKSYNTDAMLLIAVLVMIAFLITMIITDNVTSNNKCEGIDDGTILDISMKTTPDGEANDVYTKYTVEVCRDNSLKYEEVTKELYESLEQTKYS